MVDQRVQDQTTHLNDKYERFTTDYEELCQFVMEMSGSCASPIIDGVTDETRPLVYFRELEKNYCKCHCYC